jgi:RHS repeat-associated protein
LELQPILISSGRPDRLDSQNGFTKILIRSAECPKLLISITQPTKWLPHPFAVFAKGWERRAQTQRNSAEQYNYADWLGSARLYSTPSQTTNYPDMAYAPFGEGYAGSAGWIQFTGVTGSSWTVVDGQNSGGSLDDFMFRRYSPGQSRWISPDPAGVGAVDITNPQTWNRYAYVANNPLSFVDPLGLQLVFTQDGCWYDDDLSAPATITCPGEGALLPDTSTAGTGTITPDGGNVGGVGAANNFPNVTAGPAQPPPLKPRCTGPALWAGLKAAGQAFIPVPPLNNLGDPVGAMADFANDGATKAATAGVLYELATGARVLAPALDLAVDAIPVVGWAIVGAQTVNALWQGGVAYKQSIDQCYGGG